METPRKAVPEDTTVQVSAAKRNEGWGIFEPVHGVLGPAVDIARPLISANLVIGFLILLQIFTWLRGRSGGHRPRVGFPQMLTPERIATYEEIWRREESNLWDWLEERIGMEEQVYPTSTSASASAATEDESDQAAVRKARRRRERSWRERDMRMKLQEGDAMSDKEFADAIRAAEEQVKKLKAAVQKKRLKQKRRGHDET